MIRFIANPRAGQGAGAGVIATLEQAMNRLGRPYEICPTSYPGEARVLARTAAAAGVATVVAVGGDGTVHEVANSLLTAADHAPRPRLGIVPGGSGNDFARTLGIPTDVASACQRLVTGSGRQVDVGRLIELRGPDVTDPASSGNGYFVNGLGVGFTAAVAIEARSLGRLTGLPLYVSALLLALVRRHRTPEATLRLADREIRRPITFVDTCNGQWEGGGFWIAPRSEPDDGQLDVVIGRGAGRLAVLRLVPRIIKGTHVSSPLIEIVPARQLAIELARPVPVQADGEIIATAATFVALEVVPGALTIL